MAKRGNEQDSGSDKGGMRILYVELNGNNPTLQEGLRTLVAAMNRPVQVAPPPPRRLISSQSSATDHASEPELDLFTQDPASGTAPDMEEVEQADQSPSTPRRKRSESGGRDRNAGLTIVKDLDLYPSGKESLKDFFAKKQPKTQEEHIAVYIYYLKNVLEAENVGYSHMYTCFKEIGGRMPGDLPQTCRNAASNKGWIDTADASDLKRTTRGDNFVEQDLPRTAGGDN